MESFIAITRPCVKMILIFADEVGGNPLIMRFLGTVLVTISAYALNAHIGNIWVAEGLYADKYGSAPPMQFHEIILFLLSAAIGVCTPGLFAAWLANEVAFKKQSSDLPKQSTLTAIRIGKNPQLISGVLTAIFALLVFVFTPGLFA